MANIENILIDTHTHTRASDGTFTPEESVKYAASQGIKVMAKTDHDTIYGNELAIAAGIKYGVKVIPGIEIDAVYFDEASGTTVEKIELLGLNIDGAKMQPFCDKLSEIRFSVVEGAVDLYNSYIASDEFKQQNSEKVFPIANPQQISIDDIVGYQNDKMNFENPKPFISKTTVMQYLLSHQAEQTDKVAETLGGNRTFGDEFKAEYKFLFAGQAPKITFYEAIAAVKEAGGTAVIAHPGRSGGYKKGGMVPAWNEPLDSKVYEGQFTPEKMVVDLIAHGLDGVELYNYAGTDTKHADQQGAINEYFTAIADKHGLITTFGSDCHGEIGKGPQLGKFGGTTDYSHLFE